MTLTPPVRIGIVGVGNFGRLHACVLAHLSGCVVVAVCDPDRDRRRRAAEIAPAAAQYPSFEALLQDGDLDAVVLATPESRHATQAIAAMKRGWHVLIEKPLALSVTDACAVLETARSTARVAMVGTILRFSIPHRQLADAVRAGYLGRVLHIHAARHVSRSWFSASSVHPAFRAAVHDIDQVLWLTGQRVARAAAAAHQEDGNSLPGSLVGLLFLAGGATATVESHFLLPPSFPSSTMPPERHGTRRGVLEVFGTEGIARLDEGGGTILWTTQASHSPDPFVVPSVGDAVSGALRAELEHFVACVAAGTASPLAPLHDSVHGVAVAEALVRAAERGDIVSVEDVPG